MLFHCDRLHQVIYKLSFQIRFFPNPSRSVHKLASDTKELYIYIYLVFIFIYKSAECTKARITLTFSVIKIKKILIALLPVIFIKYYSSSNIPSVVLYPFKMFCSFVLLSALSVQVFLNQRQNGSL